MWNFKKILVLGLLMLGILTVAFSPLSDAQAQRPLTCPPGSVRSSAMTLEECNTPPPAPVPCSIQTTDPSAPCYAAPATLTSPPPATIPTDPATVAPATEKEDRSYHLLEPIPCYEEEEGVCENGQLIAFDPTTDTGNNKLGLYLNIIIKLFIGLCAVAAVVMIVIAGVEYSTSELISNKEAAKERIRNAILGLLLALGSYTILFTINPDLLNTDVDVGGASITSEGEMVVYDLKYVDIIKDPNFAKLSAQQINDRRNTTGIATLKGSCSVAAMTAAGWPNPQKASCVCQGESSGKSQPNVHARCADGSVAVTGLWQINMVAHQDWLAQYIPECRKVYSGRFDGRSRNCKVIVPKEQYLACANAVNNPAFNTKFALALFKSVKQNFAPTWEYATNHCGQY